MLNRKQLTVRNLAYLVLIAISLTLISCGLPVAGSEDIPWPMPACNPGGSGYSPYLGIGDPWFIQLLSTYDIDFNFSFGQSAWDQSLLIGKGGILLVRVHDQNNQSLAAVDTENSNLMWTYPVAGGNDWSPVVGPEGKVYLYDRDGFPTILSSGGEVLLRPKLGPYTVLSPRVNRGRTIPVEDHVYWLNSHYSFSHKANIKDPRKIQGFEEILCSTPWVTFFDAAAGDDSTLYVLSMPRKQSSDEELRITLSAYSPGLTEKWSTDIAKNNRVAGTRLPHLLISDQGIGYVLIGATGMPWKEVKSDPLRIIAVKLSSGRKVWEHELHPRTFSGLNYSRPVVGDDGSLYVLSPAEGGLTLRAINWRSGESKWETLVGDWGPSWKDDLAARVPPQVSERRSMLVSADGKLYVEITNGVKIVDTETGEVVCELRFDECVPPVGKYVKAMTMGADGTLYFATGRAIMKTVSNRPPRIVSFVSTVESYVESTDKVRIGFDGQVLDPLGWNRRLTFHWDYGDGTTSTKVHRSYEKEGGYRTSINQLHHYQPAEGSLPVKLTVTADGCSTQVAQAVTDICLDSPLIGGIDVLPEKRVYVGEEVTFFGHAEPPGCSSGELHYSWDFDDGSEDTTGVEVRHVYERPGEYEVELTVNPKGSKITSTRTVLVKVLKAPKVSVRATPLQYTPQGLEYEFTSEISGNLLGIEEIENVSWDFGDGGISEINPTKTISHIYGLPGEYEIISSVTLREGFSIHGSTVIDYSLLPQSRLSVSPERIYLGLSPYISCKPVNKDDTLFGLKFRWIIDGDEVPDFGDNSSISFNFEKTGVHTVKCVLSDPNPESNLSRQLATNVNVVSFPVLISNGESIPYVSNCRGACGLGCPGNCMDIPDIVTFTQDPYKPEDWYRLTFSDVLECGSHAACRWHDAWFDYIEANYGEEDILGPMHNAASGIVGNRYGAIQGGAWAAGSTPYDRYILFSKESTVEGPYSSPETSSSKTAHYRIDVYLDGVHYKDGDGVYLSLYENSEKHTDKFLLNDAVERHKLTYLGDISFIGQRDTFYQEAEKLEDIIALRVDSYRDDYYSMIDVIRVVNYSSGQVWHFDVEPAGETTSAGLSYTTETNYKVSVLTGNVDFAGTDAKVYIILHGTNGVETLETPLDYPKIDEFEKGQTDMFSLVRAADVGNLEKITLRRDDQSLAPDWYCKEVGITKLGWQQLSNEVITHKTNPFSASPDIVMNIPVRQDAPYWYVPVNSWIGTKGSSYQN